LRKLILLLLIVAAIAAALAILFAATTARDGERISFPLSQSQRSLLALVPAHAETFALIPSAASVRGKLETNPMMRKLVDDVSDQAWLPAAWMLGDADLLVWRADDRTSYAFRVSGLRRLLVRAWLTVSGADLHVQDSIFFVGVPPTDRLGEASLSPCLQIGAGLPPGEALVIQRSGDDEFPPIERPAVSTLAIGERDLDIVSRAPADSPPGSAPRHVVLPRGAMLSAWFGEAPRIIGDIDRLIPGQLSPLLAGGGSAILYDIESGLLLPRPKGLFVIPASPDSRRAAERLKGVAELVGQVVDRGDRILISIDRTSLPLFEVGSEAGLPWPASEWAMRVDAARLLPVLEDLGDHVGLRFAAPRLSRGARNLRQWLGQLQGADRIEAALVSNGQIEELRVKITAK
jgi:hypothetical protein